MDMCALPVCCHQAGLKKVRKQLELKFGLMTAAADPMDSKNEVTKGPMFRKFFQTGDDDDTPSTCSETPFMDSGINPDELWRKVRSCSCCCWGRWWWSCLGAHQYEAVLERARRFHVNPGLA